MKSLIKRDLPMKSLIKRDLPKELDKQFRNKLFQKYELVDIHGQTLLMYAIRAKKVECAKVCLKHISLSDLNRKERANRGSTALHLAVQFCYHDLVCDIVKKGANVKIRDAELHTPLSLSSGKERYRIKLFLSNAWRRRKWSPLIHEGTPLPFQKESITLAKINWKLRLMSRDVLSLVLESLLELHRREFNNETCKYGKLEFIPTLQSISKCKQGKRRKRQKTKIISKKQCNAKTKNGDQCKLTASVQSYFSDKCWIHRGVDYKTI